ncbi:DnaJ domain-containing protein [Candidatus Micrarchaeota archaeon]|jgi:molecular chaperone DnaJ|nr:DnaJ domain-containing protein [Candidatus Micrarchaeota archaeon]
MNDEYYKILGVSKDASEKEIKKAYRKMAMKHHPDKGGDPEEFKKLSEAYAVLSDSKKRQMYDNYGAEGVHQRYSTEDIFRNADFSDFEDIFSSFGFGDPLSSIFGSMFGGGFGRKWRSRDMGEHREVMIEIELEDAAAGIEKEIKFKKLDVCPECEGVGGKGVSTCQECKGAGVVKQIKQMGPMRVATTSVCPKCGGHGQTVKEICKNCQGKGKIQKEEKITVKIPEGINDGMAIRLTGMGDYGKDGYGDGFVHVRIKPNKTFERDGKELFTEHKINISQAIFGDKIELKDIYGKKIELKIPEGTQSGEVITISGHGMPGLRGGRGDLHVRINVEIPKPSQLNKEQKEALKQKGKKGGFLDFLG